MNGGRKRLISPEYILLAGCVLVLAALIEVHVRAQATVEATTGFTPARPVTRQPAAFTHITIEQGLSDQRVEALAQDRAGFMWFGTNNGLNRFDGYSVVTYRNDPMNPHSLSGNLIGDIYEDRAGTLWVGTRSGLDAFDRRTERFTHYRHDPRNPRTLSSNTVVAIYEDRSGVLWVGTTEGLNRFDRATGTFTAYRHDPADTRSLSNNSVRAITEDGSGMLWVGTLGGLNRLDPATGRFTVYRHDRADPRSLTHDVVWDLHEDRTGALWVATDGGGLSRFEPATGTFTHYRHDPDNDNSLSDDRLDCLFEDASGALWIGTFGGGVSVLDAARRNFRTYRRDSTASESLSQDYVAEITGDRSGLIWIGTHGSGVDVHDPRVQAFTVYQHDPLNAASLASNSVWAVSEEEDGTLWIGTQDRGLDRFDPRSGRVAHFPPDPEDRRSLAHPWVSTLQPDRKGGLWVGTYGGGLYHLDPASGRFTAYRSDPSNPDSLSHDAIVHLYMDRSGILWVGTRGGGLNRFDPASGRFTVYRHDPFNRGSLSHDWVWHIVEDPSGSLWIGTFGGGLNRLDPATGEITRYVHDPRAPSSLSDNAIWTLHVDRSGVLWVGTSGGGLDRFDETDGSFIHYRERDGLASDRVVSILEDGDASDPHAGNLWIATGRGLSKLERDRKTFRTYGTMHGLPVTEYNSNGQTTRRGELLMASSHGLIVFDPDAVRDREDTSPMVFTNFLLANNPVPIGDDSPLHQAIDHTASVTLGYDDRVISLEFAALNYRTPRQSRYRYMLEGFDDGWITVGSTQRLVTYTNLAPGEYVFRVTTANADGTWNENGRAIALVVTPPWWATWWFRGLALVLIAGCATGIYARRVNRLERRRLALEAEIAERKQAEETLRASHRQIEDLAGRLITAQEVERSRIARDLHDDVCQTLAVMSIAVSDIKHRRGDVQKKAIQESLSSLQRQTISLVESVRRLSHDLHPSILRHVGLAAALEAHCIEIEHRYGVQVTFTANGDVRHISRTCALSLFRIAQEALRNAAVHGNPRRATVAVARSEKYIELTVVDDGSGFDLEHADQNGRGLGLKSMEERTHLLGGQLQIITRPNHGTVIRVLIPPGAAVEAQEEALDTREASA
jgi:ligand-binding sensor domain-containing protein/signal transduction histidine kinase